MIRLADTGGGTPLYRLKIMLRDCKPPIWRRVVVRADMKLDRLHRVIQTGANACPPEDCGGSPGYAEFVDAMADPKHEQHEEMKEWVGGAWDATRFSLEHTNAGLKRIKA
jgi:hypothetical protein